MDRIISSLLESFAKRNELKKRMKAHCLRSLLHITLFQKLWTMILARTILMRCR